MATTAQASPVASFGLGYGIAAFTIAIVDAFEAYIPSFSEWAEDMFFSPWFHLPILGALIFFGVGLSGIGGRNPWRRTAVIVGGSMVVCGLWIFTSTMVLAMRGGM
jgi:hypothetical protein